MSVRTRKDGEPFTVGLLANFAPDILGGIIYLAKQIDQTAKNVASNKEDCYYLARKVQQVVGFLQEIQSVAPPSDTFIQAVFDLEDILMQCLQCLEKFSAAGKFQRIRSSNRYKMKFEKLNRRLDECERRLSFGMIANTYVTLNLYYNVQCVSVCLSTLFHEIKDNKRSERSEDRVF